jgi:hypothetical protein
MSKPIGYIICESALVEDPKVQIVREDTIEVPDKESGELKKHRRVIAQTILQSADMINRNRRIYPKAELFPQLESDRTRQLLAHGQMKGEAGHPLDTSLVRQQTIDEKLTSVRYLKFWTEGNYIWGEYKGTNNTCFPGRGFKTKPTVFCKSCEPKPKREKRDVPSVALPCESGEVSCDELTKFYFSLQIKYNKT